MHNLLRNGSVRNEEIRDYKQVSVVTFDQFREGRFVSSPEPFKQCAPVFHDINLHVCNKPGTAETIPRARGKNTNQRIPQSLIQCWYVCCICLARSRRILMSYSLMVLLIVVAILLLAGVALVVDGVRRAIREGAETNHDLHA